ncbi:MAG: caspase family protein [Acidobacteriota bacterium]|nr:caspase family protein [Acidobacteriota bacterium]
MHLLRSSIRLSLAGAFLLLNAAAQVAPGTGQRGFVHPEVEPKFQKPPISGKTYALLVGVSLYKNDPPITSLRYANKDAETFAELLKKPIAGSLKEPDEIRLLTDEKATRAALDDAIREFASKPGGPTNTLILFVGGHGVYLTEEEDPVTHRKILANPYILLHDTNMQDAKTTGYPMDEFRRMIAEQALRFGRVLVFLDVCHAANVAGIAGGSAVQDAVKRAWQGQAGELGVMMASHAGEEAIESPSFGGGHGAFSYFVLSGLNGTAALGESSITFADLAEYVRTNVRRFTHKAQDPFDEAPNTGMVIIADTRKEGLALPPAQPLSDQELRAIRRRRGSSSSGSSSPPTQAEPAGDAFQNAIQRGLFCRKSLAARQTCSPPCDAIPISPPVTSGSENASFESRLRIAARTSCRAISRAIKSRRTRQILIAVRGSFKKL